MKILWFSNSPALGIQYLNSNSKISGTGGWLYTLNKLLQNSVDLNICFHYPYKIENFQFEETKYYPVYSGNIFIQNFKSRFLHSVYDTDFLSEYLKIIDSVKPDLIHIHGTENSFLCLIGKVNIPILISIQGNLTVYHHKYFSGFHGNFLSLSDNEISWKSILLGRFNFKSGYIKMGKMAEIERKYLKSAKYIMGRTDWDKYITSVLAPQSTYFVGNEILRDLFYKKQWDNFYSKGTLKIITTNGNSYYKGFETICLCLNLLNELGLNIEWRVAGVSQNSLINLLTKKFLKELYPKKGLVLLGSIAEDELVNNLLLSNIYVMASHIENSPNNLCEAMILGMPCISTTAGGSPSMLTSNIDGLLVQDGDPWAMAGAVLELVNNVDKSMIYSNNARRKALTRHNKELILEELLSTYNKILNN